MDVQLDPVTGVPTVPDYLTNMAVNPTVLIVIAVVIILYYVLFASLGAGTPQPGTPPPGSPLPASPRDDVEPCAPGGRCGGQLAVWRVLSRVECVLRGA